VNDLLRTASVLKRFAAKKPAAACELCARTIGARHAHLYDATTRALACACEPCATLMKSDGSTRWLFVPPKSVRVDADLDWDRLGVPIGLAFFVNEGDKMIARYPSPAGTTAHEVPPAPAFDALVPHLEALLVCRLHGVHGAYVVSIDRAFELAGLVKKHWSGISGGETIEPLVRDFFAVLEKEAR
jgi:hypothetical protein